MKYANNSSSFPRLKNGNENGDGTSNDCVTIAIIEIAAKMGKTLEYNDVNNWIIGKYGTGGVPSGNISEVIEKYFESVPTTIQSGFIPPSNQQVFVVFNFGDGTGHATRYLSCFGDNVLCTDGVFPLNQVSKAFTISGVK